MNNLPILSGQSAPTGKMPATNGNAPTADDIAGGTAPFGQLLSKQLSSQAGADIKSALLKKLTQVEGDAAPVDPLASGALRADAQPLTADLLASLLPQDKRAALTEASAGTAAIGANKSALPRELSAQPAGKAATDTRLGPVPSGDGKTASTEAAPQAGKADTQPAVSAFAAALHKQGAQSSMDASLGKTAQGENLTITPQTPVTHGLLAPAAQTAATPAALQHSVQTPVGQPQWAEDFGQKVTLIATQRNQSAELHLNPAQLGPVEISLKLNGDHATVQFTSAHAAVRDAIEQSLPRLREMMAESGISLGNTTVSDQAPREQQARQQSAGNAAGGTDPLGGNPTEEVSVRSMPVTRHHDGMVDTFA
ncbi:MAG: flagellar hook-length control protein FliK [Pseudomonadota bacterium]